MYRQGIPRRVPGLRRSEVAVLAGVSVEYYARLESSHLFHLAQAADGTGEIPRPRRRAATWTPRLSLTWVLDSITGGPALVRIGRMDLLATNPLGRVMRASVYGRAPGPVPNVARYTFLDQDAGRFYPDWDTAPTPRSRSCAPRPAATPTTGSCTTSSASPPPAPRRPWLCSARLADRHTVPLPAQRRRVTADDGLVDAARRTACALLKDDHEQLRHSAAVAAQAACLTDAVADDDAPLLVAAAWLHDVGYASHLVDTAFHPVDGARHLRPTGWDRAICDLVAHHSGSRFVANARGLDDALHAFTFTENPVSDALTVAH